MINKVFGIKEDNFERFIKKINEFNKEKKVFATQTHLGKGIFYAIIYYEEDIKKEKIIDSKPITSEKKGIPATDRQRYALKQLGIEFNENITKEEAFEIIKESREV